MTHRTAAILSLLLITVIAAGNWLASDRAHGMLTYTWPFTTAGDYTYDSSKVIVQNGIATLRGTYTPGVDWIANDGSNSWGYRKPITVNNGSGGTLSNYQFLVTTTTVSANISDTCDDLRFTSSDGTTSLPYWIESGCNTATTKIWVKAASLSTGDNTVYMYYGNGSAAASASGANTFIFFDDFSGNLNKWTTEITGGGVAIDSGSVKLTGTTHASLGSSATYSSFQNGIIEGKAYISDSNDLAEVAFRGNYAGNTGYKARMDARASQGLGFQLPPYSGWGSVASCTVTGVAATSASWQALKITVNGSSFTIDYGGQTKTCTDATYSAAGEIALQNHNGSYTRYDDVRVRAYASAEPTVTVGSEAALSSATYPTDDPTIVGNTGQRYTLLDGFIEHLGSGSTGTIKYQLSPDDGSTWYWWSGASWATTVTGYSESNTAADVNSNIGSFTAGSNPKTLKFKAFLHSDGNQQPKLDALDLTYLWDSVAPSNPGSVSVLSAPRNDTAYDMGTSTDYTYDSNTVEYSGGAAQLKNLGAVPGTNWAADSGGSSFDYREAVTVNNATGGTLSNYQVKIDEGLVGHWQLDEATAIAGTDSSGYGNNTTVAGTAVVAGKFGNGRSFGGTVSDLLVAPYQSQYKSTSFTVAAYVNVGDTVTGYREAVSQYGGGFNGWMMRTSSAGDGHYWPQVYVGSSWYSCDAGLLTAGSWVHLALSYDGETMKGYINGSQICQNTNPSGNAAFGSGVFIGGANGGEYFKGSLDEVRLYNRVLSTTELTSLKDSNKTGYLGTLFDHANETGSDLRFTSSDYSAGAVNYDYWIERFSASGQAATIWVEVPSLVNGDNVMHMYYGNSNAAAASNGPNTFVFFDDFSGDLSKWTKEANTGNIAISSGYLQLSTATFGSLGSSATYSGFQNGVIEGNAMMATNSIGEIAFRANFAGNTGYKSRIDVRAGQGISHLRPPFASWGFATGCTASGTSPLPDKWYNFVITVNSSTLTIQSDNTTKTCTDTTYSSAGEIALQNANGNYARYDNIRVRAYASSIPTITAVGAETAKTSIISYAATDPTIINTTGITYTSLYSFAETLGGGSAGTIHYQISPDGGSNWYWWNGGSWASTTNAYSESNTASDINTNIGTFTAGSNPKSFKFKALLHSDGSQQPKLDNLTVNSTAGSVIAEGNWQDNGELYCYWTAPSDAADTGNGETVSGVAGYYVYFGTDPAADPVNDGAYQTGTAYTATPIANAENSYLRIKTKDNAGNISSSASTLFTYGYYSGPTVSSVDPSSGSLNGGTAVTISGNSFLYTYERPITLTNSSGSTQTDYQVSFTIDTSALITAGKMTADGHDIRVKNSAKDADLPFWIEPNTINTGTTKIWVKVGSIPTGSSTIYLNYGNASLSSQSNASSTFIREVPNLLADWHFDENSGTTVGDASGNNNAATAYGSPGWVDGKFGKALNFFSGTSPYANKYVKTDGNLSMNENFTALAWVKPQTEGYNVATQRIFETDVSTNMGLVTNPGGYLVGWTYLDSKLTTGLSMDAWQFVALRYDGATKYVTNNATSASKSVTNSGTVNLPMYISGSPNYTDRAFQGVIDEPAVFSRSLSDAELSDIYNNFGYATANYPGKMLVKKTLADGSDPSASVGAESVSLPTVTFDGSAATSIVPVNSTTITAVTPAHAVGAVDVAVTTAGKTGTLTSGYTYEIPTITVSGTIYTADNESTNVGAGKTVAISVQGAEPTTVETGSDGTFTFNNIVVNPNDLLLVYVSGETEKASLITRVADNTTNVSGLKLYADSALVRSETGGAISDTLINVAYGNYNNADTLFSFTDGKIAYSSSSRLFVPAGYTYTPGADITANDIKALGTFDLGANSLTVTGNFEVASTKFSVTTGTVNFTATSGTKTITSNGNSFKNIVFNDSGGSATFRPVDALDVNGTFTLTDGILDLDTNDPNVNIAGSITVSSNASITKGTGTITFDGDLSYNAAAGINFGRVQIGASPDTTTLNSDFTADILTINAGDFFITSGYNTTIAGNVDINGTLDATTSGGRNSLISCGGDWDATGGTFTASTSTVKFTATNSSEAITDGGSDWNNLEINGSGGVFSIVDATVIAGDLTVADGILSGSSSITVNGGDVTGNGQISLINESFIVHGSGNFGGTANWRFYDLVFGDESTTATTTKTSTNQVRVDHQLTVAANHTLDAGNATWVLTGGGYALVLHGNFVANTSTVRFIGGTDTSIPAATYYNLETAPTAIVTDDAWLVSGSRDSRFDGQYTPSGTINGQTRYWNGFAYLYYNWDPTWSEYRWAIDQIASNRDRCATNCTYATDQYVGSGGPAISLPGTWGMGAYWSDGITVTESIRPPSYILDAGTITVTHNLTNGDGNNAALINADFNDPTLDIEGNFINSNVSTFIASNSAAFSVSGDWSNAGTFTNSFGTITLDGSGAQQITANGTGVGKTINNLIITNSSSSGISFADSLTVEGTFTDATPDSKLIFNSGSTYAFANISISGTAGHTIGMIASSTSAWLFNVSQSSPVATYVTVSYSNASGGNRINATIGGQDSGNNTNWDFPAPPLVTLSSSGSPLSENGGSATVTATLSKTWWQTTTINLSFSGSAVKDSDYTVNSETIVISSGDTQGSITISGMRNYVVEGDLEILVDVDSVTNGTENGTQQESVIITDYDTVYPQSGNYRIPSSTTNLGGNYSISSVYHLWSSIGDAVSGQVSSANYRMHSGVITPDIPVIGFSLSTNTISLGSLSPASVATGNATLTITTNVSGGYSIAARDNTPEGIENGMLDGGKKVADATTPNSYVDLPNTGTEHFGIIATGAHANAGYASGTKINSLNNQAMTDIGSYTNSINGDELTVTFRAGASASTPASNNYRTTAVFTCTVNF